MIYMIQKETYASTDILDMEFRGVNTGLDNIDNIITITYV